MQTTIKHLQHLIANPPAPDDVADGVKIFDDIIANNTDLVHYDESCPLFIMLVGAWSDNAKKVRRATHDLVPNKRNLNRKPRTDYFLGCLQSVLRHGGNPNIIHQHCHGSTAMHWLIAWDRPIESVEFLNIIAPYATPYNPNMLDRAGNTALTLAVVKKYFNRTPQDTLDDTLCIRTLIEQGTDVLAENTVGQTALSYAIWKRDTDTVHDIFTHAQNPMADLKSHAQTAWQYGKNLSYEDLSQRLKIQYSASPHTQIIHKERWDNVRLEFDEFMRGILG